jgi:biotin carboxylase
VTRIEGSLLVLGAGEEQVAIYQEARRRGLPTIGVDMRSDRPGVALADTFLPISTTDPGRIAEALAGQSIAGVVSTAADTCLESWHRLTEWFGTPWRYPAAAARVSMDKAEFHRIADAAGIPTYRWIQSGPDDVAAAIPRVLGFPVVVKPADSSGSRGVRRVGTSVELAEALAEAVRHSPRGQVIAEECLTGRDLTVNVFLVGGRLATSVISEKRILPGSRFLIGGHVAPAPLDPATERALLADALRLCAAFDLRDGPANFDVILTADGTRYVLEVGARMSGNGFPQLATAATGTDWMAALVDLATGRPVRLNHGRRCPTGLRVLTSPLQVAGELLAVEGVDLVAAMPGVVAAEVFAAPGSTVLPFTEAGRKLGWIVATADRYDLLDATLDRAIGALRFVARPHRDRQLVLGW